MNGMRPLQTVLVACLAAIAANGAFGQSPTSTPPKPTVRTIATATVTGNNNVIINSSDVTANPLSVAATLAAIGSPPITQLLQGDELAHISALESAEQDKRDVPKAFQLYLRAARKGNHQAQIQVGRLLLDVGSSTADARAYKEFEEAGRAGSAEAIAWQAWMHDAGRVPNRSLSTALTLYERAATEGVGWAAFNLGIAFQRPALGTVKDEAKALKWYWRAADAYFAPAFREISWIMRFGEPKHRDVRKGLQLLEQGAKLNDCGGLFLLGYAYHAGQGVTQDHVAAVNYYRRAAACGDSRAQNNLGNLVVDGNGTEREPAVAIANYRKAIYQGNVVAAVNLGLMFENGNGVTRDYIEAVKWYRHAADHGSPKGKTSLGRMYRFGSGVERDATRALELFREAAAAGDLDGVFQVAAMYDFGDGVAVNKSEAAKWYRRGVELGDFNAMNNLAVMIDGVQVSALPSEAPIQLWTRAATLGNAMSQLSLGIRYLRGQNVEVDTNKGLTFLRKSAALGNTRAQTILADALFSGKYQVKRDVREAVKLATQAAPTENEAVALLYAIGIDFPNDVPKQDAEHAFSRLSDLAKAPNDSNHVFAVLSLARATIEGKSLPLSETQLIAALYKLADAGNEEAALLLFRLYYVKKPALLFAQQGLDLLEMIVRNAGMYRPILEIVRDFYHSPTKYAGVDELTQRMDSVGYSSGDATRIAWSRSMVDREPDKIAKMLRALVSQANSDAVGTLCDLISKYKIVPASTIELAACTR